jgi:hypothetical protein
MLVAEYSPKLLSALAKYLFFKNQFFIGEVIHL